MIPPLGIHLFIAMLVRFWPDAEVGLFVYIYTAVLSCVPKRFLNMCSDFVIGIQAYCTDANIFLLPLVAYDFIVGCQLRWCGGLHTELGDC